MNKNTTASLDQWHKYVSTGDEVILDQLLSEEVIFYSPIVFKAQQGKFLTFMYLRAATSVFSAGTFKYIKEVTQDQQAILEFEADLDGIVINGVDIITFNDDGKITEFKVMVRPLKAINFLHLKMKAGLEAFAK